MSTIDIIKKLNKSINRYDSLLRLSQQKRLQLMKTAGIELYGKSGDMIIIKNVAGDEVRAKILFVEESYWSEIPYCVVELDSFFNGQKVQTHISSPDQIVRKCNNA